MPCAESSEFVGVFASRPPLATDKRLLPGCSPPDAAATVSIVYCFVAGVAAKTLATKCGVGSAAVAGYHTAPASSMHP